MASKKIGITHANCSASLKCQKIDSEPGSMSWGIVMLEQKVSSPIIMTIKGCQRTKNAVIVAN